MRNKIIWSRLFLYFSNIQNINMNQNELALRAYDRSIEPSKRIRALVDFGGLVNIDDRIPIRRYYKSGNEILRMARVYLEEQNYEHAFVLFNKFIILFVEKLKAHPDYGDPSVSSEKEDNRMKLKNEAFPRAEKLKQLLCQKYQKEYDTWKEEEKQRVAEEMAAEQRARELQEQAEAEARYREEREWLDMQERQRREQLDHRQREEIDLENDLAGKMNNLSVKMPPSYDQVSSYDVNPPVVPPTDPLGVLPGGVTGAPVVPSRALKPKNLLPNSESNSLLGINSLRTIVVPSDLTEKFLNISKSHTERNIEMCAELAGSLRNNTFTITHFIVTKQTGTADSCQREDDVEMSEFMFTNSLTTLGWIHTHPSQTAFLSSVDMHTHWAYQLMLPEAIAIVCAPKHFEVGFFNLTATGMEVVGNCKEKSGFHLHPNDSSLFEECDHATLDDALSAIVIDLR